MSDDKLTISKICAALNVKPTVLRGWVDNAPEDDPFPREKVRSTWYYDPKAVADWLIRTGKAAPVQSIETGPVFTKVREVAAYFKVNPRTVMGWLEDPSFPGKTGQRGPNSGGHFSAVAVAKWIRNTGKTTEIPEGLLDGVDESELEMTEKAKARTGPKHTVSAAPRDRLTELRADKAEIELHKLQGQMIDAQEAIRHYQRSHSYTVTTLRSLPSRVQAGLPSHVDERTRQAIDKVCKEVVDSCREMIAELIEGDTDESE